MEKYICRSSVKADKALEMVSLVEDNLVSRKIISKKILSNSNFLPHHVVLTYLLIGFDPSITPWLEEELPSFLNESNLSLYSRMGNLAGTYPSPVENIPISLEQDAEVFEIIESDYSVDSRAYNCCEKISLADSVRHCYKKNKISLANLIADISLPLFKFDEANSKKYLVQINSCINNDFPDIYQLSSFAKAL